MSAKASVSTVFTPSLGPGAAFLPSGRAQPSLPRAGAQPSFPGAGRSLPSLGLGAAFPPWGRAQPSFPRGGGQPSFPRAGGQPSLFLGSDGSPEPSALATAGFTQPDPWNLQSFLTRFLRSSFLVGGGPQGSPRGLLPHGRCL